MAVTYQITEYGQRGKDIVKHAPSLTQNRYFLPLSLYQSYAGGMKNNSVAFLVSYW